MSAKTLVENWYDTHATTEEHRLDSSLLEFEVTSRVISQCIQNLNGPQPKAILDLGGGPGRYALRLARQGHSVTLSDISSKSLQLARKQCERENIALTSIIHANALDIAQHISPSSFDITLCLGPLYHLLDPVDRQKVIENCIAATRPGGFVLLAYVTVFAHLRDMANRDPGRLLRQWDFYEPYLESGKYERKKDNESFHVYLRDVEEEVGMLKGAKMEKLLSCEGFLGYENARALAWLNESEVERWVDLVMRCAQDREVLGCADHLLVVLKKVE